MKIKLRSDELGPRMGLQSARLAWCYTVPKQKLVLLISVLSSK